MDQRSFSCLFHYVPVTAAIRNENFFTGFDISCSDNKCLSFSDLISGVIAQARNAAQASRIVGIAAHGPGSMLCVYAVASIYKKVIASIAFLLQISSFAFFPCDAFAVVLHDKFTSFEIFFGPQALARAGQLRIFYAQHAFPFHFFTPNPTTEPAFLPIAV